jgi:hypothetical protein
VLAFIEGEAEELASRKLETPSWLRQWGGRKALCSHHRRRFDNVAACRFVALGARADVDDAPKVSDRCGWQFG